MRQLETPCWHCAGEYVYFCYHFCFPLILLTDESTDSSSGGGVSSKVAALPPTLKRMLSEKDKEGQTGPQSGGSPNKTTQDGGSQNLSKSTPIHAIVFNASK